jgi:hypothetical protein
VAQNSEDYNCGVMGQTQHGSPTTDPAGEPNL